MLGSLAQLFPEGVLGTAGRLSSLSQRVVIDALHVGHTSLAFLFGAEYPSGMGLAYAILQLSNPNVPTLHPITVRSLADTGALHLCLPPHVALKLQLEELQKREVVTADGKKMLCPYVGPVEVSCGGLPIPRVRTSP